MLEKTKEGERESGVVGATARFTMPTKESYKQTVSPHFAVEYSCGWVGKGYEKAKRGGLWWVCEMKKSRHPVPPHQEQKKRARQKRLQNGSTGKRD